MTATATVPHADRLMPRRGLRTAPAAEVDLAVEELATLVAGAGGDETDALDAVARAAARLARRRRRGAHPNEERPVAMVGQWSLENGMLPHIVLGEN